MTQATTILTRAEAWADYLDQLRLGEAVARWSKVKEQDLHVFNASERLHLLGCRHLLISQKYRRHSGV